MGRKAKSAPKRNAIAPIAAAFAAATPSLPKAKCGPKSEPKAKPGPKDKPATKATMKVATEELKAASKDCKSLTPAKRKEYGEASKESFVCASSDAKRACLEAEVQQSEARVSEDVLQASLEKSNTFLPEQHPEAQEQSAQLLGKVEPLQEETQPEQTIKVESVAEAVRDASPTAEALSAAADAGGCQSNPAAKRKEPEAAGKAGEASQECLGDAKRACLESALQQSEARVAEDVLQPSLEKSHCLPEQHPEAQEQSAQLPGKVEPLQEETQPEQTIKVESVAEAVRDASPTAEALSAAADAGGCQSNPAAKRKEPEAAGKAGEASQECLGDAKRACLESALQQSEARVAEDVLQPSLEKSHCLPEQHPEAQEQSAQLPGKVEPLQEETQPEQTIKVESVAEAVRDASPTAEALSAAADAGGCQSSTTAKQKEPEAAGKAGEASQECLESASSDVIRACLEAAVQQSKVRVAEDVLQASLEKSHCLPEQHPQAQEQSAQLPGKVEPLQEDTQPEQLEQTIKVESAAEAILDAAPTAEAVSAATDEDVCTANSGMEQGVSMERPQEVEHGGAAVADTTGLFGTEPGPGSDRNVDEVQMENQREVLLQQLLEMNESDRVSQLQKAEIHPDLTQFNEELKERSLPQFWFGHECQRGQGALDACGPLSDFLAWLWAKDQKEDQSCWGDGSSVSLTELVERQMDMENEKSQDPDSLPTRALSPS